MCKLRAIINKLKSLKVAKWRKDEWRMMKDEWKVMKDEWWIMNKDVLIALRDKWSNDPSIYNPHEAPTLVSLMLLKEISEWYMCVCIDSSHQTLINLVLDGQIINYLSKFATCFNHWRQTWFSTHRWHCICAVFLCFNLFHIPPLQ